MSEEFDSHIDEAELRDVMGDDFTESALSTLRKIEEELVPRRVELSEQADKGEVSNAFFALEVNSLSEELLVRFSEVIGEGYCREYFGFGPGDGFSVLDAKAGAEEDNRFYRAMAPYQVLYPRSADDLGAAASFVEQLRRAAKNGLFFCSLGELLVGIEQRAHALVSSEPDGCNAWFVLNESNDINDPFFPFVCNLVREGVGLIYASDRSGVISQIDVLRDKIAGQLGSEAAGLVDHVELRKAPRLENLCFLTTREDTLLEGFAAFRSMGTTVGGYVLPNSEAEEQWKDLHSMALQASIKPVSEGGTL